MLTIGWAKLVLFNLGVSFVFIFKRHPFYSGWVLFYPVIVWECGCGLPLGPKINLKNMIALQA